MKKITRDAQIKVQANENNSHLVYQLFQTTKANSAKTS